MAATKAITVDAGHTTQAVWVNGVINVTFKHLTIANGNPAPFQGNGAGISNHGAGR